MDCVLKCTGTQSSMSVEEPFAAVSFDQFDMKINEKLLLYQSSTEIRPVVFTDDDNVGMWQHESLLIRTDSPMQPILATEGTNEDCLEKIEKKWFPLFQTYFDSTEVKVGSILYISIIVSDNGAGTPHHAHLVMSPKPVDGSESKYLRKHRDMKHPTRRLSKWTHQSRIFGLPPEPSKRAFAPQPLPFDPSTPASTGSTLSLPSTAAAGTRKAMDAVAGAFRRSRSRSPLEDIRDDP